MEDVRTAVAAQTANQAKGNFSNATTRWEIGANDQLMKAADYQPLIVSYRNGAAVKLSDIATVQDSVQTVRSLGLANAKRAALIIIFRQPGANIISTVDAIQAALPQLHASIDPAIDLTVALDQTQTIRASVSDIEKTLMISIFLVVLVVFVFLRELRSTLIPLVAVPVSIVGCLAAMYLLGYSIDNLSLMALTISTGFVVDDAIVVLENITRYREQGMDFRGRRRLQGCGRNWLNGVFNESFARGRVHSHSAHGGHYRASFPRVRHCSVGDDHGLARRVTHYHSHDVFTVVD